MLVKICGITRIEDARLAQAAGADFLGFILASSPRRLALWQAVELLAGLTTESGPTIPQPVLVFRDAALSEISTAVRLTGAGWVQLHGNEDASYLETLRSTQPILRIIKAWGTRPGEDPRRLERFLEDCAAQKAWPDVLLMDHHKEANAPTAAELDRLAARAAQAGLAVWRAGGLNPQNVAERLRAGMYLGVDVASGVEAAPGLKDPAAVRTFIERARAAGLGSLAT